MWLNSLKQFNTFVLSVNTSRIQSARRFLLLSFGSWQTAFTWISATFWPWYLNTVQPSHPAAGILLAPVWCHLFLTQIFETLQNIYLKSGFGSPFYKHSWKADWKTRRIKLMQMLDICIPSFWHIQTAIHKNISSTNKMYFECWYKYQGTRRTSQFRQHKVWITKKKKKWPSYSLIYESVQ